MKQLSILLFVLLTFFLFGCEPTTEPDLSQAYLDLALPEELSAQPLPTELHGVDITWTSNIASTIDNDYNILPLANDLEVTLTATLTLDEKVMSKVFSVTILRDPDLAIALAAIQETTLYLEGLLHDTSTSDAIPLDSDLTLPTLYNEVIISWQSNNPAVLSNTGIVTQPEEGSEREFVTLTATLTYEDTTIEESFLYTIYPEDTTVIFVGYYDGATGLSGDSLKSFLHDLIDDHYVISYSNLWYELDDTDEDPNNPSNVVLLYSGMSISELNHGGNSNQWNKEHVWPRSHGDLEGSGGPAYSDLHHIRPTLVQVNSSRGNLDFDLGGTLVSNTDDCYKDSDSFEPRDDVKGDVARMLFYMAVRYEGGPGELDLELNDNVNNSGPYMGRLSILLQWHIDDPVDAFEIARNNAIFDIQGNRNPFIDHPEFAAMIWPS